MKRDRDDDNDEVDIDEFEKNGYSMSVDGNNRRTNDENVIGPKRMAGMEYDGPTPFVMKKVNGSFT